MHSACSPRALRSPTTAVAWTLLFLAFGLSPARAALTLVEKGKSAYSIVIAADALPSERYAGQELQTYVRKITGVTLPIITDATRGASREILLGGTYRSRKLGIAVDEAALGTDGFVLRTEGKRLVIAGGKPRGTLYGVYELLESKLGARWFTPEVEAVPATNRLSLPDLNETKIPALEYREVFWTEMMRDADFSARHRLNGNHYKLTEKHGGRFVVYHPFVHSLDSLVPQDLFRDHPDYFPLINGKRVNGYVQRCLSHPDVLKLSKARVRQWVKDNPTATMISVSQNDTGNWCQCPDCKALDDAEGSPAASLIKFVNAIAEDIERDYPKVRIDTLAYQYTRKPPKTLRPRANVVIRLCSIECCFAHPLSTCESPENRRFRDDIIAWQGVAPTLYVWDYTPNFAHYQQPFPNFAALQPNVRFFAQHGVKGLFEQGNYSGGGGGELGPLRAYLLAKVLWNPDTNMERNLREFLAGYYGEAAPQVEAYINLLERQVEDPKIHAHIYDGPKAAYLNDSFVKGADEILAQAEQAAENETIRFRIQVVRLPIWYVQLASGRAQGDARKDLLARFLAVARKQGISNISEGQSLEDWAKKMGAS